MDFHAWLIYLTFVLVATATPGPAIFYVMTRATMYGWRRAGFAALGNITGLFCLGVMAVTGLGAVIKTSEMAFNIIKYFGAAYLVFLGLKLIFQRVAGDIETSGPHDPADFSARIIFFQAFGVAMSNPKAIVFLTALFPQFIVVSKPLLPQFAILITTLMALSFLFLMLYAFLTHNARSWLTRPGRVRFFNRLSGSAFVCFGLLLAFSSRR
jgi:threonine/homoserine/homoserine lactone efflux protein